MSQIKIKIRSGDTVKVLSGKDRGKTGKVLRVLPENQKIVVENVNMHTKFERSRQQGKPGQRITFSAPMPVSKVMLIDPASGKSTRVGFTTLESGKKQRIAKVSGKAV